jgi:hypothetical protein
MVSLPFSSLCEVSKNLTLEDEACGLFFSVTTSIISHAHHVLLVSGCLDQAKFRRLSTYQSGATFGIIFHCNHITDGLELKFTDDFNIIEQYYGGSDQAKSNQEC